MHVGRQWFSRFCSQGCDVRVYLLPREQQQRCCGICGAFVQQCLLRFVRATSDEWHAWAIQYTGLGAMQIICALPAGYFADKLKTNARQVCLRSCGLQEPPVRSSRDGLWADDDALCVRGWTRRSGSGYRGRTLTLDGRVGDYDAALGSLSRHALCSVRAVLLRDLTVVCVVRVLL